MLSLGDALFGLPIAARLTPARSILISGGGGGFDIFAGLPLATALRRRGKRVVLSNLTFSHLPGTDATFVTSSLARVTADTE